ncbi:ubiquitin-conjugating enzyme/RWD-like protein [Lipomyces arxii]|uniref:ubiquitin-conjugating enzyme/RWD-like protein n=1 Tax=Lipomyces arxii TaxID=56418 RepID=UPI0034CF9E6F
MTSRHGKSSPTTRRILKEAKELAETDGDICAFPAEDNLFEWHFVIRGPPSSPYERGLYHGRIDLPSNYPLAPPSFRFLQDTGRFEVNREICLSISNFHAEEWLPAWGVRTALVALRSFMTTSAEGATGSIDGVPELTRREIAEKSGKFKCSRCGISNDELLLAVGSTAVHSNKDVPELSFNYKARDHKTSEENTDVPTGLRDHKSADSASTASTAAVTCSTELDDNALQPGFLTNKYFWLLSILIIFLALRKFS